MNKKIKVVFEQDFKSFKKDAEYVFEGNLNVISGINGAGKSQLLEGIKNRNVSSVYINNNLISKDDIIKYSFRDNISLPSFGTYDYDMTTQYNNVIVKIFRNYNSKFQNYNNEKANNPQMFERFLGINKGTTLEEYCTNDIGAVINIKVDRNNVISKKISKTTILQIIDIIKEKHPNDYLELSNEEIIDCIPDDFMFRFADETVEGIVRVFTEAARLRMVELAECGKLGKKFDNQKWLKTAPWTEINNLFSKLNFNYRFEDDFEYIIPCLRKEPQLFSFENGALNKRKSRNINDLSDGEKAILNLVIATYDRKNDNTTKILLLDEYDATLNPSLIKDYYLTIQEYYLNKGIIVLLSTHSPITISMAPENSKYYEIFRQVDDPPIIIEVNSEEYEELKLLEKYYDKIKNPSLRLRELEGENANLKEKIQTLTLPLVITEGKTDWKHIKRAKLKLNNQDNYEFYEMDDDMGDSSLKTILKAQAKISNSNKRIFIFDNDNPKIVDEFSAENANYKDWGNNVYSFVIPKPNIRLQEDKISIEHYYPDQVLKKEVICEDGISRRLYCGNDFNIKGINDNTHKRCDNRNECGPDKIRVLSGAGNEKVFDLASYDDNDTNYALTKESFFEKVINDDSNDIDFSSFNLILDIIKEIINVDE